MDLFMDRLQLERNWLQGDYYLHTLVGHSDGCDRCSFTAAYAIGVFFLEKNMCPSWTMC
jgi:hypothetical protein